MSFLNQDLTLHQLHKEKNHNCEHCETTELDIVKEWYAKQWISYRLYLKLTGLPF